MEFELWWLLALPITFGLGWLASRLDLRQWRRESELKRDAPLSYFRGLNFLLSEQQDKAIDAFIEAVTADPNTVDLHFALGNLFRRRGEYERAVRVHQNLLARGDLPSAERQRAQIALAQDFFKAGLLDRAESVYTALATSPYQSEALAALLQIHERTKEWPRAIDIAGQLERLGAGSYGRQIAHYWCEVALQCQQSHDLTGALDALDKAVRVHPQAVRPWQLRAGIAQQQGDAAQALEHLRHIAQIQPDFTALAALDMARLFRETGQAQAGRDWLLAKLQDYPAIDLLDAVLQLEADASERYHLALTYLQTHKSLLAARRVLDQTSTALSPEPARLALAQALDGALKNRQRYRCAACGFEARNYTWHCPACQGWETYPPRRTEELQLLTV
ncbi:lipopolysaccharide assembly protein LapB [Thiomonas sp.]|uniref:lipopolysaccharide assembly protein LapB n=1 Tax=Thiomonas sp. TaxID=2047785 RepID=UPI000BDB0A89|nr:lipopolysaccharide assembly protein LapB [Thiomonas sp.]OZB55388.1 MAG: lipopolysaccharide assembly protein LapB [Thiomonas sp. 14-66-4]